MTLADIFTKLDNIDRRIIYLFVAFSLALPLIFKISLPPAEMETATAFFEEVDDLGSRSDQIVLIAADWGPNTQAENKPQTAIAIEHLMRKRVPFAMITTYSLAAPFLDLVPKEIAANLEQEFPGEKWEYGKDWINVGYRPGTITMIQSMAKADDLHAFWETDAHGTPISDVPVMQDIKTIHNIPMLMEFTGLVGAFNNWIQFFYVEGHRPKFVHGCTSITIPDAHIYFSSKQIVGLHEGIAGAAWYEALINKQYPLRETDLSFRINTGLAFAHLVILGFILLGNITFLMKRAEGKKSS